MSFFTKTLHFSWKIIFLAITQIRAEMLPTHKKKPKWKLWSLVKLKRSKLENNQFYLGYIHFPLLLKSIPPVHFLPYKSPFPPHRNLTFPFLSVHVIQRKSQLWGEVGEFRYERYGLLYGEVDCGELISKVGDIDVTLSIYISTQRTSR